MAKVSLRSDSDYWLKVERELDAREAVFISRLGEIFLPLLRYLDFYAKLFGLPGPGFGFGRSLLSDLEAAVEDYLRDVYLLGKSDAHSEIERAKGRVAFAVTKPDADRDFSRHALFVSGAMRQRLTDSVLKASQSPGADAWSVRYAFMHEAEVSARLLARDQGSVWYNEGKADQAIGEGVVRFEVTAVLDGATCPMCMGRNGMILTADQVRAGAGPPYHNRCRCILLPFVPEEAAALEGVAGPEGAGGEAGEVQEIAERMQGKYAEAIDLRALPDVEFARSVEKSFADVFSHTDLPPLKMLFTRPGWANAEFIKDGDQVILGTNLRGMIEGLEKRISGIDDMISGKGAGEYMELRAMRAKLASELESFRSGKFKDYFEHSMYSGPDTVDLTVRHELGHYWYAKHTHDISMLYNEGMGGAERFIVTKRSADNVREMFAENFALYSEGKIELLHPDMVEFLEKNTGWKWSKAAKTRAYKAWKAREEAKMLAGEST